MGEKVFRPSTLSTLGMILKTTYHFLFSTLNNPHMLLPCLIGQVFQTFPHFGPGGNPKRAEEGTQVAKREHLGSLVFPIAGGAPGATQQIREQWDSPDSFRVKKRHAPDGRTTPVMPNEGCLRDSLGGKKRKTNRHAPWRLKTVGCNVSASQSSLWGSSLRGKKRLIKLIIKEWRRNDIKIN